MEEHQHIEDGAVDLILYDLPFGTMKMKEKNGNYLDLHFYSTYMSSSLFRLPFLISSIRSNPIKLKHYEYFIYIRK